MDIIQHGRRPNRCRIEEIPFKVPTESVLSHRNCFTFNISTSSENVFQLCHFLKRNAVVPLVSPSRHLYWHLKLSSHVMSLLTSVSFHGVPTCQPLKQLHTRLRPRHHRCLNPSLSGLRYRYVYVAVTFTFSSSESFHRTQCSFQVSFHPFQ